MQHATADIERYRYILEILISANKELTKLSVWSFIVLLETITTLNYNSRFLYNQLYVKLYLNTLVTGETVA